MSGLWSQIKDNLEFLCVCLVCLAAVLGVALLCERLMRKRFRQNVSTAKRCAYIGVFSAVSAVLMLFEIPVFFAPGFYKLDFSELPVLLCSFALGPVAGVTAEALKVVLKVILKGTTTAFVGDFANFIIGSMLVLPAAVIYRAAGRSRSGAIWGLAAGTALMSAFGGVFNAAYLLPKFSELYGIPLDSIIAMGSAVNPSITSVNTLVLFAVLPLNLLKGGCVSIVTVLLYRSLERMLHISSPRAVKPAESQKS